MPANNRLPGFRVLSLESRRATEMAKLIANYGGEPIVAPSMREVPLDSNTAALAFANVLAAGGFEVAIFLTGVGARALCRVVETVYPLEKFVEELKRLTVIARGPKPLAVLKELGVPVAVTVPEPNTWQELLKAIDESKTSIQGKRVALQEYGESNQELIEALEKRGAQVTRVPVYKWELPEDIGPLQNAAQQLAEGQIDIVLFTTSAQIDHLLQVAEQMDIVEQVRAGLAKTHVGSIGPVTSEELRQQKVRVDFEPEHPKMGFLVNAAAEWAAKNAPRAAERRGGGGMSKPSRVGE
jgi:uroporphyrinogen-III synthase